MKWKINKTLLPIKIHFFLFNAALSSTVPYLPVYAKQLGISALAFGVIYTVLPFLILVAKPSFGAIADHFQNLKLMLMLIIITTTIAFLGMNFIPKPPLKQGYLNFREILCQQRDSNIIIQGKPNCDALNSGMYEYCKLFCLPCGNDLPCNSSFELNNSSTLQEYLRYKSEFSEVHLDISQMNPVGDCGNITDVYCNVSCSNYYNNCDFKDENDMKSSLQFWLFMILMTIGWVSFSVAVSLTDTACYSVLKNQIHLYGRQRLWGVLGWGTFAALTGYLNDFFTTSTSAYSFSAGFYVLTVLFVIDLLAIKNLEMGSAKLPKNIFKDVCRLLGNPRLILFLLGVFVVGALTGFSRSYLFWYLRTLNASQLLLGLASGMQCFLGELPFFFFSGWIIGKIGYVNTITMSFISYGVRFLGYSYLRNPWWTLPIEILQGPAYGAFYSAMTAYAKVNAPPGKEATMQGLLGGTFEGLGVAAGSLLGGFGFGVYGGRNTFFCAGLISISCCALHVTAQKLMDRKHQKDVQTRPQCSTEENEGCLS